MPQVMETVVQGYASCPDPLCPGYQQEQVDVTRREALYMREEMGGDIPGIDHSTIQAVDQSVEPCAHCGKDRIASLDERPDYPPISGQDPLALLNLNKDKQIANVKVEALEQGKAMAEMRAEMAELRAELATRRGPGRPRKSDSE
jgi:hypothetical protein